MRTPTTLAAYAAALAVVFGSAVGIGGAVGPTGSAASRPAHGAAGDHGAAGEHAAGPAREAGGLAASQDGYGLQLLRTPTAAARAGELSFRITGPDGAPLTEYVQEHEKDLHLIVVRRDATGFQHLHPQRAADGTWTTTLTLPRAGTYKVLADFVPAGADAGLTLATDVTVGGPLEVDAPAPAERRTAAAGDYTVTVDGDLVPGRSSEVRLTVRKDGRPVEDLEPYLGAYGHLVALRDGDLAYLHVHPEGPEPDGPTGGPALVFATDVPSSGVYRLFLDFSHDGAVHTAALSLPAGDVSLPAGDRAPAPAPQGTAPDAPQHDSTDGHGHG